MKVSAVMAPQLKKINNAQHAQTQVNAQSFKGKALTGSNSHARSGQHLNKLA